MSYRLVPRNTTRWSLPVLDHRGGAGSLSGSLSFRCLVRSAMGLHAGTGRLAVREGKAVVAVAHRCADRWGLAGAGFKGAVRSRFEVLTGSCGLPNPRDRDCQCAACAVFGRLGAAGHLGFQELRANAKPDVAMVAEAYSGQKGYPGEYRFYDGRRPLDINKHPLPQTSPVEVLKCGAALEGSMWFRAVPEAALGMVLVAMGLGNPAIQLRVGGKKYDGLGHVVVEPERLQLRDGLRLGRPQTVEGEALRQWVAERCATAFATVPGAEAIARQLQQT